MVFFFFLFLLISFELEISKQLHSMEFGLLNFKGGLDDKQTFLDFFQFAALYNTKPSFRIFPGALSWLTQDPEISNYCTCNSTKMFTLPIQLMFNNSLLLSHMRCSQCLEQIFGSKNVHKATF